jgi:hypothetical protein
MDYANIGVLEFDGKNYSFWRKLMKTYIQEQGFNVWRSIIY